MPEAHQEIVRSGEWLYGGCAPTGVHIVQQNYEYWYAIAEADGQLEAGEQPMLNSDGFVYYVVFGPAPTERPFAVHGPGFLSPDDAAAWAATQVPAPIQWNQ